jgi:transcriptional regulator with XRE-family HTH domain
MEPNINERLLQFLKSLDTSIRQVEITLGFSNGSLSTLKKGGSVGLDKLERIAKQYDQLNSAWLLKGKGGMLDTEPIYDPDAFLPQDESASKIRKENRELKKDKSILAEQIALKDQQIQRLWKEIDELKGKK